MKKIKLFIAALVLASAVVAISINARTSNDPFFEANLEALMQQEGSGCPDPYDVKDRSLHFTQREATTTVGLDGCITILGKKYHIGGSEIGMTYTFTYEIGECSASSPGSCCPNARNGEIINVSF